ncbi:MAG: zinc-binding dehydrogenase [Chloroflexi bacterium]|nr:zinc-binding dehydrogenase [Chloroflexota bacterium]
MPDQMLAALDMGKGNYRVQKVPMPERLPGSALIRVRQTGICGSDLHMTRQRSEHQVVPSGHEIAGEIAELLAGAKSSDGSGAPLHVGDRVAIEGIGQGRACGNCYYCRLGQYVRCGNRDKDTGGGFAEYMTRLPVGCYRLPDSIDWTDAALVEPLAVSIHALRYRETMKPGDTVAVVGAATIGLAAIAAARALGARKVIASARHPQQAKLARILGADIVTGSDKGELEEAVKSATGGLGADVAVETIGGHQVETLDQAVRVCRPQGTVSILGVSWWERLPLDLMTPMLAELNFVFSNCYSVVDGRHDFEVAIDLLASGRVALRQIVTHTFPLGEIQKGFETAYDKGTGSIKVHIAQH